MKSANCLCMLCASLLVLVAPSLVSAQTASSEACANLAQQQLPDTTITAAQAVVTGSFTVPGSANVIGTLPPFCRVAGVIAPTSQSQIVFEVWLPLQNWNGKFAGVGNGGWAGTISVLDDGRTRFVPSAGGRHRYLSVQPAQRSALLASYTGLVSAPPMPRPT